MVASTPAARTPGTAANVLTVNEDVDSPTADVPDDSTVTDGTESGAAGAAAPGMVHEAPQGEREPADLDAVARDLDGVDAALRRLDDGSYWTDEVTGAPIPDEVLAADPVARRAGPSAS